MNVYIKNLRTGVARILGFFNRDVNTQTCGSFDRYHWGWKKKDFQDSTLIFSYLPLVKGLALLGENPNFDYYDSIVIDNIKRIMHQDGSFDQVYPNERQAKTGLDFTDVLYDIVRRRNGDDLLTLYRQIVEFTFHREEGYAIISNHSAHFLYEYLLAYSVFNERKYYRKAVSYLSDIEENTDNEGWHREYSGGDPGYQSRTLRFLTKSLSLLHENDQERCLQLCKRSFAFLEKTILPDGTIYPMFGSRNTGLLYPSGIEYMDVHQKTHGSDLANRIRQSISNGIALAPHQLEFDNFIRVFDDYLDAGTTLMREEGGKKTETPDTAMGDFHLPHYGLKKTTMAGNSIFFHYRFGGAMAVYRGDTMVYKDSGFVLQEKEGAFWGTRQSGGNCCLKEKENHFSVTTQVKPSQHKELTPFRQLLLRIFNLTLLRYEKFSGTFRKFLVRSMVEEKTGKSGGTFKRSVSWSEIGLELTDEFNLEFVPKRIWRAVNQHIIHMACSRYYSMLDLPMADYEVEKSLERKSFSIKKSISFRQ